MSTQITPTLTHLSFTSAPELPHHFVHTISGLLSPTECAAIIPEHKKLVPSNITKGTVRKREVFKDCALAVKLWERIQGFYAGEEGHGGERGRVLDDDGDVWVAEGLNDVFRLCLYKPGGKFSAHTDGRRLASLDSQAFMTLNIYLNTVPSECGGATRFLSSLDPMNSVKQVVLGKSQPMQGSAAIFRDDLWHDGEEVMEGNKWLLRTDIMFKREVPFDWEAFRAKGEWVAGMSDELREAKGRKALSMAEGLEDAGDGAEAIRWYKIAYREWPALERGG